MKILFVAPWQPSVVRPRSFEFLKMLARRHEVRMLTLYRNRGERTRAQELRALGNVRLVHNGLIGSVARVGRSFLKGEPLQTGYSNVPGLTKAFCNELALFAPDLVHLNVLRSAHLLREVGDVPTVIDLDEFRSDYFRQMLAVGGSRTWKTIAKFEWPRTSRLEGELLKRRVPIIVSSPHDLGPENVHLVRTACDIEAWSDLERQENGPELLFVGRLHYQANVDALDWFMQRCFPGLHAIRPDVRITIAGEAPPRHVRAYASPTVRVLADVPDMRALYARATVALIPVRAATGVQMKLIQAMAAGVPAITTAGSADRAGVHDGREVLVADEPADWIQGITRLLDDADARMVMAARAREFAIQHHGREAVVRQLEQAYAATLAHAAR